MSKLIKQNVDPTCCMTLIDDIGTKITVSNLTNSTLEVKVSRQVISSTQGTINYFCWTACYGSQTSVSPQSKSLAPQEVDNNSFEVHFDNLKVISQQMQQLSIVLLMKLTHLIQLVQL